MSTRSIGHGSTLIVDSTRGDRVLGLDVWYPTDATTGDFASYELLPGIALPSTKALNAAQPTSQRLPLIIWSHGRTGLRQNYSQLCESLAGNGFIVAVPDHPGDTLIEATSGNTGIALAMAAAVKGYRMVLIMPEDLSIERAQTMKAFGAELILTPKSGGMEYARDLAEQMQREGKGLVLDQFGNPDNPRIHYETTGPEIWADTHGKVTHFVSAMGTTGTITGVSRYLKEQNPQIRIIGAQPANSRSPVSSPAR